MNEWLKKYKDKAYELHKQGKLVMFSHSQDHIAYKTTEGEEVHARYICPKCQHKEEINKELKMPYKIKCPGCKFLVWKTKLQKKRGRKKDTGKKTTI